MLSEGIVTGIDKGMEILNLNPEGISPSVVSEPIISVTELSKDKIEVDEKVELKDHPMYSKYFKMLKVGLPRDAVKAKMAQEGVAPDMIDKDPSLLIFLKEPKNNNTDDNGNNNNNTNHSDITISDHPKYGKYFRMLKVGLPRDAIKAKMQHEGMNPSFLDKDPNEIIPLENSSNDLNNTNKENNGNNSNSSSNNNNSSNDKVTVADHPMYSKYFKMLKVGLPREAIKAKMAQEGVNPTFLDKDPNEMISITESKTVSGAGSGSEVPGSVRSKSIQIPALGALAGGLATLGKGIPKLRKKKLYWKALDASQVGRDSLWADKDDDITLDEAEFNQLFVERYVLAYVISFSILILVLA